MVWISIDTLPPSLDHELHPFVKIGVILTPPSPPVFSHCNRGYSETLKGFAENC